MSARPARPRASAATPTAQADLAQADLAAVEDLASRFRYRVRVSYVDTDQGGVVHHAAYLRFLEQARVELLRARGIDYRRFEQESRKALPVAEVRARYKRPARFDDELEVETWVGLISRAKIRFDYRIWRAEELIHEAEITCACVCLDQMRLCSMAPLIRAAFEE